MKLDNKGFAITSILYTLLIVFLMILVSVLSGLRSRKNMMEKSVESVKNKWEANVTENLTPTTTTAPQTGKYKFTYNTITCFTYIKKGASLEGKDQIFQSAQCNNNKNNLKVKN